MAQGGPNPGEDAGDGPLAGLLSRAEALGGGTAPVHLWNPDHCGTIPMHITADGTWHYNGSPIRRERLVQLFARILRREDDGSFVLVTPAEKVAIRVDDAPFLAVELASDGTDEAQRIVVRTNVGDVVTLGRRHPLRISREETADGFIPYVLVRGGLEAKFTRAAAIDLAELAAIDANGRPHVRSDGAEFHLDAPEDPAAAVPGTMRPG